MSCDGQRDRDVAGGLVGGNAVEKWPKPRKANGREHSDDAQYDYQLDERKPLCHGPL